MVAPRQAEFTLTLILTLTLTLTLTQPLYDGPVQAELRIWGQRVSAGARQRSGRAQGASAGQARFARPSSHKLSHSDIEAPTATPTHLKITWGSSEF